MINVRVAASKLEIAEVRSFERQRIYGVSNLNAVRNGIRVLLTIHREFVHAREHEGLSRLPRRPAPMPAPIAIRRRLPVAEQAS